MSKKQQPSKPVYDFRVRLRSGVWEFSLSGFWGTALFYCLGLFTMSAFLLGIMFVGVIYIASLLLVPFGMSFHMFEVAYLLYIKEKS